MKCRVVRPRPAVPPQTIHLALPLTRYDGGTWLSCEPHRISFLGFGRWKRYLGHSSAVNFQYLRANTRRAFLWLLHRSESFFSSQRFPSFSWHIPPHCWCRSRQTFVLQLFADFSCRISSFILCFFYNFLCGSVKDWWSTTSWLVVKLLWTWPLRYQLLLFCSILAVSRTDTPDDRRIAACAL